MMGLNVLFKGVICKIKLLIIPFTPSYLEHWVRSAVETIEYTVFSAFSEGFSYRKKEFLFLFFFFFFLIPSNRSQMEIIFSSLRSFHYDYLFEY